MSLASSHAVDSVPHYQAPAAMEMTDEDCEGWKGKEAEEKDEDDGEGEWGTLEGEGIDEWTDDGDEWVAELEAQCPPRRVSSRLVTLQPSVLVATLCTYLSHSDILALRRTCEALSVTMRDAVFSSVAWSVCQLRVDIGRPVIDLVAPQRLCLTDSLLNDELWMPLSLWQRALPIVRMTLPHCRAPYNGQREWLPSKLAWSQSWREGKWRDSEELERESLQTALDAALAPKPDFRVITSRSQTPPKHHLVLAALSRDQLQAIFSTCPTLRGMDCPQSRLAMLQLQAVLGLQHLHLVVDTDQVSSPPIVELVSLVPHLRSLHLEYVRQNDYAVSTQRVLELLPSLTSLTWQHTWLTPQHLLDIAAHATLEHIWLEGYDQAASDGDAFKFCFRSDNTEEQAGLDDADEPYDDCFAQTLLEQQLLDNMRRISQPSRRSLLTRLALLYSLQGGLPPAQQQEQDDRRTWLQRRLQRQRIPPPHWHRLSDDPVPFAHRMRQVAWMRSQLRQQLASVGQ